MGDSLLSELFKDFVSLSSVAGGAVVLVAEVVTPVLVCIGVIAQIALTLYRIKKVHDNKDVE